MTRATVILYLIAGMAALVVQGTTPWLPWFLTLGRIAASISIGAAQRILAVRPAASLLAAVLWCAGMVSFTVNDWIVSQAFARGWWVFQVQAIVIGAAGLGLVLVALDGLRSGPPDTAWRPAWLRATFSAAHLVPAAYMLWLARGYYVMFSVSASGGLGALVVWVELTTFAMWSTAACMVATTIAGHLVRRRRLVAG